MSVSTTLPDVVDGMVTTIRDLTPTMHGDRAFDLCQPDWDLRTWLASGSTEAQMRRFEVVPVGANEDPLVEDPTVNHYGRDVQILVAYPSKPLRLYGDKGLRDLERTIAADASLIRDAMYDAANMPDGATFIPRIEQVERDEHVWYLPVVVRVQWFELKNT